MKRTIQTQGLTDEIQKYIIEKLNQALSPYFRFDSDTFKINVSIGI